MKEYLLKNYERLGLLENAVLNYSGGIGSLYVRVQKASLLTDDPIIIDLLSDVEVYLRDISSVGMLDMRGSKGYLREIKNKN